MDLTRSRRPRDRRRRRRFAYASTAIVAVAAAACSGDSDPLRPPPTVPIVVPACASPAPLTGSYDPRTPSYIVATPPNSDDAAIAARLTRQYLVQVLRVYEAVGGLNVKATPTQVARLRCDADVKAISFNGVVHLD